MKSLIDRITGAAFLRNIALLASGTAVAQILTVLAYPILMRLYTPADFGLFALFGVITMTGVAIGGWNYHFAIVLARTEKDAANLLTLTLYLLASTVLFTAILLGLFGAPLMRLFGTEELTDLLFWVAPSILAFGSYTALSFWSTRYKQFSLLSSSQIMRAGGTAGFQIGTGLAAFGVAGLIMGQILGQMAATGVLALRILRSDWPLIRKAGEWAAMKRLAREHQDFPKYNVPANLLNSTSITIPSILLVALFNPAVAGLYWFAYRLLEMPITLIGDAIRRVLLQRSAELDRAGHSIQNLFLRTTGGLAVLALVPALTLIVLGPFLFEIAFGAEWRDAGYYAQWIAVWWFTRVISLPALTLVPVLNLQKLFLMLEIGALLPRLAVLPIAAQIGDADLAIAAYTLVGAAFHLVCFLVIWLELRQRRTQQAQFAA